MYTSYTIDRGFVSPYFIKDQERQSCEQVNPRILVTDRKIDALMELVPLLESIAKAKEPLFIVCEDLVGEALSGLVVNKVCVWVCADIHAFLSFFFFHHPYMFFFIHTCILF
jgi:chaperonin GroEL (HSP60 family)